VVAVQLLLGLAARDADLAGILDDDVVSTVVWGRLRASQRVVSVEQGERKHGRSLAWS